MTEPELTPEERDAEEYRVSLPEALALVDDIRLIRAAIDASGMSARRFAVDILTRDERTVRRWLAGDSPLPRAVRDRCESIVRESGERAPR
jgi:hypothetical protein